MADMNEWKVCKAKSATSNDNNVSVKRQDIAVLRRL